jgi:hypothetical protein
VDVLLDLLDLGVVGREELQILLLLRA